MNKIYSKFNFKTLFFVTLFIGVFGFGAGFLMTPNVAQACGSGHSQSNGDGCVNYSASLTINNTTGGNYTVGDAWTLRLTSNIPNTTFSMCGTHIPGVQIVTCTPNWGTTDANGNWTSSSNFKTEDIGIWNEYIKFPTKNVSTNVLSFTVSKPAPVNHAPVITLVGSSPVSVYQNTSYVDAGATALDQEDGNITWKIQTDNAVNTALIGTYSVTYNVKDSGGLSATPVVRTVNVVSAPVSLTNINIIATKIICNSESDLPNWGLGGPDITVSTASQFLASHPNCHLAPDWKFQWASSTASDPGISFVGEANGWNTFGPTNEQGAAAVSVSVLSSNTPYLWVREVLKDNYLPFTYQNNDNSNSQSAEMYCRTDVLNYDNYDRVDSPFTSGGTYYCVAFNVKTGPVNPPANTPPTIQLNGDNPLNLTVNTPFVDPGATAKDLEDGDALTTSHIIRTGTVDASTTGSYILTYSVTDSGGLSASTTRTVVVNPVVCTSNCGGGGGPNADLSITKTADKNTPNVGDTVTYNISVVNNGPDIATAVTVTDSLPSGLNFVSATSTVGDYSTTTEVWTIGDLANTSSATLTIVATVATGTEGQTITNTAVAASTQDDSNPVNNTGDVSIVVNTPNTNPPGGGGSPTDSGSSGGGRKGGHRHSIATVSSGEVLGAASCSYLRDYLKIDWKNDPIEVLKLQSFLNVFEGEHLSLTGIYEQTTFDAVVRFQTKYSSDILIPWGPKVTKGFTYILTKKKVNEIYCKSLFPVNQAQQNEIDAFRASGWNSSSSITNGASGSLPVTSDLSNVLDNSASQNSLAGGLKASSTAQSVVKNMAVSLFALPQKILNNGRYFALFLILIIIIVISTRVLISSGKSSDISVLPRPTETKIDIKKESPAEVLPDEEIIVENPEEGPEEVIVSTPDLRDDKKSS